MDLGCSRAIAVSKQPRFPRNTATFRIWHATQEVVLNFFVMSSKPVSRRDSLALLISAGCASISGCGAGVVGSAWADTPLLNVDAVRIRAIVETESTRAGTQAVQFGMWVGRQEVLTMALGNSMTTVPATTNMHYRIGGITWTFQSTLLLMLAEQGRIRLDDTIARWYAARQLPMACSLASHSPGRHHCALVPQPAVGGQGHHQDVGCQHGWLPRLCG